MASKFYYNLSDSVGEDAAKMASDSGSWKFTTPSADFKIHDYYVDVDAKKLNKANYRYITPTTSNNYGGWASYTYYAIAKDKFYCTSWSGAWESFKFVHKLSAPLLKNVGRNRNWGCCQAPFEGYAMGANYAGFGAKIYWNNSTNKINVDILNSDGTKDSTFSYSREGYGVFILLSGAGGGGGGGDNEYWAQGQPGGGGGGGGGTALMYFDAKRAYSYSNNIYLYISIGYGGAGGKGGNGFSAGSAGGNSIAQLKNGSGTNLLTITCGGGKGGAGHSWDAAADSAGGAGGTVTASNNNYAYSEILKLLDSASGGSGGAGKRGSDGNSGAEVAGGDWKIPFTEYWKKRETFSDVNNNANNTTYYAGWGTLNNKQGGGGGGCSAGYRDPESPTALCGCGMGGCGGGGGKAGKAGANGYCAIFYNYIPGVSTDCDAEKY